MGDFERVKEAVSLKDYAEANLEHVRGGYVCPICKSGTGPNKTPAFSTHGSQWKCFSCDAGGDIFDLAGYIHDTTSRAEQLRIVASWGGVSIDADDSDGGRGFQSTWSARVAAESATEARKTEKGTDTPESEFEKGRESHRRYIAECAERFSNDSGDGPKTEVINYLEGRGIPFTEACKLGIGYDPDYKGRGETRVIIPWAGSDYYHIDRVVDGREKDKYNKPNSDEVGPQPIYNPQAFEHDYIVVVEGAIDAIAVKLCGFNAVALGGTGVRNFANEAAARGYTGVVIDMLDADGNADAADKRERKGRGAGADLVSLLAESGITTLARDEYGVGATDDYGGCKDAGEWFEVDRAGLSDMLEVMRGFALEKLGREKDREYREALKRLKVEDPARIARGIYGCEYDERPISTGFKSLDAATNGGLRSGLVVFGAVSSAGKTTLLSQIADFVAANGRPVLFVSIEQSGRELVSKSLSRLMARRGYQGVNYFDLVGSNRPFADMVKEQTLADVIEEYAEVVAPNLHIMAASEQPTINDVKAAAYNIAERRGVSPLIMLDYLQILKPQSERDTERQAVDFNISELRRLAGGNGLKTPVVTISSLNRGSYSGAISMESFKESGGVEYGADLLLGLQPYNMKQIVNALKKDGTPPTEQQMKFRAREVVDRFREQPIKDAELVFLKNRNGALPERPLPFTFYGASSLFVEGVNHF